MRAPPDLLELRLDHLVKVVDELDSKISMLRIPLIITARHPAEGGANNLPMQRRRELLFRFLPRAQYVDVELRSAKGLRSVLETAHEKNIRRIISFHDFNSTPTVRSLCTKARAAKLCDADVFKVATRTDTQTQLARLLEFITNLDVDLALSVMGIGKLGRQSRRELIRHGSVLNYAHLGRANISAQPTLSQIRRWTLNGRHAVAL
ncbi:MAG: type I 3-dehydroquinate dehydratase [Verrucomicrobiota bacterium]|nr:type I 3-dehydroquinate dehydratase [Verrucomicrobiota bacterium]